MDERHPQLVQDFESLLIVAGAGEKERLRSAWDHYNALLGLAERLEFQTEAILEEVGWALSREARGMKLVRGGRRG